MASIFQLLLSSELRVAIYVYDSQVNRITYHHSKITGSLAKR